MSEFKVGQRVRVKGFWTGVRGQTGRITARLAAGAWLVRIGQVGHVLAGKALEPVEDERTANVFKVGQRVRFGVRDYMPAYLRGAEGVVLEVRAGGEFVRVKTQRDYGHGFFWTYYGDIEPAAAGTEARCVCADWTRSGPPFTRHHPTCERYDPVPELLAALRDLLVGIELWGSRTDGIPDDCWDEYRQALYIVRGQVPTEELAKRIPPAAGIEN